MKDLHVRVTRRTDLSGASWLEMRRVCADTVPHGAGWVTKVIVRDDLRMH